jgi:hypothetical protein
VFFVPEFSSKKMKVFFIMIVGSAKLEKNKHSNAEGIKDEFLIYIKT